MARGRRSRERFSHADEQQQWQYFDFQGRQISCEHLTRRVVRYELDGSITIIADNYNGKHLNSPNDVVPHPDGSIWFTDPPYGSQLFEGAVDAPGGPGNPGHLNPKLGQPGGFVPFKRELPTNVYRWDPSGRLDIVVTEDQVPDPNGILFSPDYKKLYVISTGKGPGDTGPGGKGDISVFDVGADNKLSNQKLFTDCVVDGVKCGPDGMRCDVDGNVWCRATPVAQWVTVASRCGTPPASSSAVSVSRRSSPTLTSAVPNATGCSLPRANRSTRSIRRPRARGRAKRRRFQMVRRAVDDICVDRKVRSLMPLRHEG